MKKVDTPTGRCQVVFDDADHVTTLIEVEWLTLLTNAIEKRGVVGIVNDITFALYQKRDNQFLNVGDETYSRDQIRVMVKRFSAMATRLRRIKNG